MPGHRIGRRILGLETEYGLSVRVRRPGLAAWRRLPVEEAAQRLFAPVATQAKSSNAFLRNGGRLYLDVGSHPEYATPECLAAAEVVVADRAGDEIVTRLAALAGQGLAAEGLEADVRLLKNNADPHGNAYGSHENYSVARSVPFPDVADRLVPFLVTRPLICGAGALGPGGFVLSSRAAHLQAVASSATTHARPLVNVRDEPHADPSRWRRLHVLAGDSNLSEPTTRLKLAATRAVLAALEDALGGGPDPLASLELADPIGALRQVVADPTGRAPLLLADGRTITALDIQWEHLDAVRSEPVEEEPGLGAALDLWERTLAAVEADRADDVAAEIEWVAKRRLLRRYADRHKLGPGDPRLAQVDLAFHELGGSPDGRPRGLFRLLEASGQASRLTSPQAVAAAEQSAPGATRARVRGRFLTAVQALDREYGLDWASVAVHDLPGGTVTIGLDDPFAATDACVDALLDRVRAEPRAGPRAFRAPEHGTEGV